MKHDRNVVVIAANPPMTAPVCAPRDGWLNPNSDLIPEPISEDFDLDELLSELGLEELLEEEPEMARALARARDDRWREAA